MTHRCRRAATPDPLLADTVASLDLKDAEATAYLPGLDPKHEAAELDALLRQVDADAAAYLIGSDPDTVITADYIDELACAEALMAHLVDNVTTDPIAMAEYDTLVDRGLLTWDRLLGVIERAVWRAPLACSDCPPPTSLSHGFRRTRAR